MYCTYDIIDNLKTASILVLCIIMCNGDNVAIIHSLPTCPAVSCIYGNCGLLAYSNNTLITSSLATVKGHSQTSLNLPGSQSLYLSSSVDNSLWCDHVISSSLVSNVNHSACRITMVTQQPYNISLTESSHPILAVFVSTSRAAIFFDWVSCSVRSSSLCFLYTKH